LFMPGSGSPRASSDRRARTIYLLNRQSKKTLKGD
jgi:hypothetical protein